MGVTVTTNAYNFAALDHVIAEARRTDLSVVERASLFAAATAYGDRLQELLDDHHGKDGMGYERGKLNSVVSNLGIVLGFGAFADDKPHAGNWTAIDQDWHLFTGAF